MKTLRAVVAVAMLVLALTLQVSVMPHLSIAGVVPNLCLLVVVGAALTRGPGFGMMLGLVAGLMIDLAPPADHVAGRWALALVVVGYLAGRMRPETRLGAWAVVVAVAGCSFVGTSVFALSGVVLRDPAIGVVDMLTVIAVSVGYDVLLTPLVLPVVLAVLTRLEPERERVAA
ncbi:rod shape-determining protein MreD [Nocardioides limicola]|uniref:rod shape-determining protein MreD n=1 Tax=Nocardioides limicola TaxID=2803368 RepID=UPI00193BFFB6|nr:rod shape-determining protein MreD [Nocardioides sp. DJM-14]